MDIEMKYEREIHEIQLAKSESSQGQYISMHEWNFEYFPNEFLSRNITNGISVQSNLMK